MLRHQQEAAAKENEGNSLVATRRAEYDNTRNNSKQEKEKRFSNPYMPVRQIASPGYIAVYSPSKKGYSVYDEYDSDNGLDRDTSYHGNGFCNDEKASISPQHCDTPPIPQPPLRTCTLPSQHGSFSSQPVPFSSQCSPVPMRIKQYAEDQCLPSPPPPGDSDMEMDMYSTMHGGRMVTNYRGGGYGGGGNKVEQYTTGAKGNIYSTTPRMKPGSMQATV